MVEDSKKKTETEKKKIEESETKKDVVYNILKLKGKCTSRDIANYILAEYKQIIDIHDVTSALNALAEDKKIERIGKQGIYLLWHAIPQIKEQDAQDIQQFYVNTLTAKIGDKIAEINKQIKEMETEIVKLQNKKSQVIETTMKSITDQILNNVSNKLNE